MKEALYSVEFGDLDPKAAATNRGVVVMDTNRIYGGDSGYYYHGEFTANNNTLSGTARVVKHDPNWSSAWADASDKFTIKISAKIDGDVISGKVTRDDMPGVSLPVVLKRLVTLP